MLTVLAALHGHPVHRRFVGGTGLILTGQAPDGRVISVGLLELPDRDDVYRGGRGEGGCRPSRPWRHASDGRARHDQP